MVLKAILFNFNGIIIKDKIIHQQLINDLLLGENLRPLGQEYQEICLGKRDRFCLRDILAKRGRLVADDYLDKLLRKKADAYYEILTQIPQLPIYERIIEFILHLQSRYLPLGMVSDGFKRETEYVLERMNIRQYFSVILADEDLKDTTLEHQKYLLTIEKLNQNNPDLSLTPSQCLVIESTPLGIQAGKKAGMSVVAVANTYPFHLLQRLANWCVDDLMQLDLDWIDRTLTQKNDTV